MKIRFRAWDKFTKSFVDSYGLRMSFEDGRLYKAGLNVTGRYELTQYTGMQDRKGTPIFEGDIIELDDGGSIDYVVFQCGGFMAKIGGLFLDDYWNLGGHMFVVIGNRFENPELLEVKE